MTKKLLVKIADNFERNLEDIERFLVEAEAPLAFNSLLDELSDVVIPNLERYPEIGRAFLVRPALSIDVVNAIATVTDKLAQLTLEPSRLREYVLKHYLILYVVLEDRIVLLAIRHHKQISFDFAGHWSFG